MLGWTKTGQPTLLGSSQGHAVRVLMGHEEPDEAFDRFWRTRGNGKRVAVVTAARYLEAEAEHELLMGGMDMGHRLTQEEAIALGKEGYEAMLRDQPDRLKHVRLDWSEPEPAAW